MPELWFGIGPITIAAAAAKSNAITAHLTRPLMQITKATPQVQFPRSAPRVQ